MATRSERGVTRVLEKLEASVKSGQYYEAHQMYRTLYFRYISQKKYTEVLNLLYKGSTLLLEYDQQCSGADLALLVVDVLVKSDTKPSEEWIDKLAKLFASMNPNMPEREMFLANTVKWSMNTVKRGHPLLHKKIAEVYWREHKFKFAHRHFLHSNDGEAYAKMLIEQQTDKGCEKEIDLFITQAVFQLLCLRNKQAAKDTFMTYTSLHPEIKNDSGPPYTIPLLNFLWFLLQAVEEKNETQFLSLKNSYEMQLKRDPNYLAYMDRIGLYWFGIRPARLIRGSNSMLGGLLKSLIGGVESSEEEAEANRNPAAPIASEVAPAPAPAPTVPSSGASPIVPDLD